MTTFVKITNKDIYNKIEEFIVKNGKAHEDIIEHQLETNGKVKFNTKMVYAFGGALASLFGWFVYHLINCGG